MAEEQRDWHHRRVVYGSGCVDDNNVRACLHARVAELSSSRRSSWQHYSSDTPMIVSTNFVVAEVQWNAQVRDAHGSASGKRRRSPAAYCSGVHYVLCDCDNTRFCFCSLSLEDLWDLLCARLTATAGSAVGVSSRKDGW